MTDNGNSDKESKANERVWDIRLAQMIGRITRLWRARFTRKKNKKTDHLKGVIIITGASGGIGQALALEFARLCAMNGQDLLLTARNETKLDELKAKIKSAHDIKVHVVSADLIQPEGCRALIDYIADHQLHVATLINNAAIGSGEDFVGSSLLEVKAIERLNMDVVTELCHIFLPDMLARQDGVIVNVASLGALTPIPHQSVYYATKAYITHFTEGLAFELTGKGVRIAALLPGPTATPLHQKLGSETALYLKFFGQMDPEIVARSALRGTLTGLHVLIVPGLMNSLAALAMRVIPAPFLTPVMGILFKPR